MERGKDETKPEAEWANFPLAPCHLIKLQQYYYAIGNSPARNIFYGNNSGAFEEIRLMERHSWRRHTFDPAFEKALESGSKQVQDLRVLCLACGDLRNILFSLGSTKGLSTIELVINDYDIHVVARNVLLLDMIFDTSEKPEADENIFAIWFSTGLYEHQRLYLQKTLQKLVEQSLENGLTWKWQCFEPDLLAQLRSIWEKWLGFFQVSSETVADQWQRIQETRHTTVLEKWSVACMPNKDDEVKGHDARSRLQSFIKKYRILSYDRWSVELDTSYWNEEIEEHLLTGIFLPNKSISPNAECYRVNPTLFRRQDKYDLHYGSDSFSAFPVFLPTKGSTAVDSCFSVFKQWLDNARRNRQKLSWTFSCLDCQTFCLNFDANDLTSNVKTAEMSKQHREASRLSVGSVVVTKGLKKSPGLNGCLGIVSRKAPEELRWAVQLIKQLAPLATDKPSSQVRSTLPKKAISLKETNLSIVTSTCGPSEHNTHAYFDVVTTSNVADHIGLSTLLFLARPLLVPGGTLLTTSFLHMDRFGSTKEYLSSSLLESDPAWWPTLFGFRAMGYESNSSTSPSCKIAHTDYEFSLTTSPRSDATIIWLATDVTSNLYLAEEGPIARHLLGLSKNTPERGMAHNLYGKAVALLCRLGCSKLLAASTAKSQAEGVLLGELLTRSHVAGAVDKNSDLKNKEVILCSFEVEDDILRKVFCSARSPTPTIYARLRGLEVHGLWLGQSSSRETRATHFFFWCKRSFVEEAGWKAVLYCAELGAARNLQNIRVEQRSVGYEKIKHMASMLTGCRTVPSMVDFDVQDLVNFRLFDESDSRVIVWVQINTDVFGKDNAFSSDNFSVEQSNRFALTVKMSVPGNVLPRNAIVRELFFSTPIDAKGWKFDTGCRFLTIQKGNYGFFSTTRTSTIPGCTHRDLNGSEKVGWTDAALEIFSGAQFTKEECAFRRRKDNSGADFQMPMLAELKDSIIALLQLKEQLIYLQIKEGDIGIVAFVIRHGLLMDSQKGLPVLDLSICFLSSETSPEMANAVYHLNGSDGGMRRLKMWIEEYRLFQNLCNYTRATMAPELRVEHPSLRHLVKKQRARANFRRVLLKPFFASAGDSEDKYKEALGGISLHDKLKMPRDCRLM
jgi:hypothetical protein